jgi:hypothetical protein
MFEGGCGASSGYYDSEEKAIAAWNRRAGDDTNVATNADRIRSMSDEELAEFLEGEYGNFETGCAVAWLRQPAEDSP